MKRLYLREGVNLFSHNTGAVFLDVNGKRSPLYRPDRILEESRVNLQFGFNVGDDFYLVNWSRQWVQNLDDGEGKEEEIQPNFARVIEFLEEAIDRRVEGAETEEEDAALEEANKRLELGQWRIMGTTSGVRLAPAPISPEAAFVGFLEKQKFHQNRTGYWARVYGEVVLNVFIDIGNRRWQWSAEFEDLARETFEVGKWSTWAIDVKIQAERLEQVAESLGLERVND